MALSSSSMRPASGISYSSSRPMAYAVDYQSRVSSAFEDSLKVNGVDDIQAAAPVQYATATRTTNAIRQLEANRETNSAYNDLAAFCDHRSEHRYLCIKHGADGIYEQNIKSVDE